MNKIMTILQGWNDAYNHNLNQTNDMYPFGANADSVLRDIEDAFTVYHALYVNLYDFWNRQPLVHDIVRYMDAYVRRTRAWA